MKNDVIHQAFEKYYTELYYYALSLCHNEHMAQDLVSESFYRALLTAELPHESFKYWLYRVLKNCFIDEKRRDKHKVVVTKDWFNEIKSTSLEDDPEAKYLNGEDSQALYTYLMALEPVIYREVVYLYYYADLSVKEVALFLKLSESNVKTLLFRARKKLNQIIEEDANGF